MTRPRLEFWFEFASTYSYPAAMRIEEAARKADIDIAWRPFLLGPLLKSQQGLADSPFNVVPEKGAYMWRDVARICAGYGFDFKKPSVFPRNGLGAARVVQAAAGQDWTIDFIKTVYRANFVRDLDIGDPGMLAACVIEVGGDPVAALTAAETRQTKQALARRHRRGRPQGHLRFAELRQRGRRAVLGQRPARRRHRLGGEGGQPTGGFVAPDEKEPRREDAPSPLVGEGFRPWCRRRSGATEALRPGG